MTGKRYKHKNEKAIYAQLGATLSRLAEGCAIADTCGAKTGLATWSVPAVASVTDDSEVARRELSAPAVSNYVISIWMHGQPNT